MWFSEQELQNLTLRKDDVVVVEGGAGFGRTAVLEEGLTGWGFQNSINRLRVDKDIANPYYIHHTIQSMLDSGELTAVTSQATIPHLTAEKLEVLSIPFQTREDQEALSNYINNIYQTFDKLIQDITESININSELKNSLVNQIIINKY